MKLRWKERGSIGKQPTFIAVNKHGAELMVRWMRATGGYGCYIDGHLLRHRPRLYPERVRWVVHSKECQLKNGGVPGGYVGHVRSILDTCCAGTLGAGKLGITMRRAMADFAHSCRDYVPLKGSVDCPTCKGQGRIIPKKRAS